MIEKLRDIVTRVAAAPDSETALREAVVGTRRALDTDACGVYLVDAVGTDLVLAETQGLDRSSRGQVRLRPGEGVVGVVRESREILNCNNVSTHPRFKAYPITQEQAYQAFLGAPMLHRGEVIGVLAVWRTANNAFDSRDEAFLSTAATLLSGTLTGVLALGTGPVNGLGPGNQDQHFLYGVAGAPGVAVGDVVLHSPFEDLDSVPDRPALDIAMEETAFLDAVAKSQRDILNKGERMKEMLPSSAHALFEVHSMLAGDEWLKSRVIARIREGIWAPAALRETIDELASELQNHEDDQFRARSEDLRAVGLMILAMLNADQLAPQEFPERTVLVGDEITLAQIAEVPRKQLLGIACTMGSSFSHVAVIANALGIPAVMGVPGIALHRLAGKRIAVDGYSGRIMLDPPPHVVKEFTRLADEERELSEELHELRDAECITKDGTVVSLQVNAGLLPDLDMGKRVGPAGVGLYRSEFTFMLRDSFPSETDQYESYHQVLAAFGPLPVTMRTLDIGGDKMLPYFPIEQTNSLLGWRGVRVTLQHPEIMLAQLKAMLRAHAEQGNLRILLPMVSNAKEVRDAKALVQEAAESLQRQGVSAPIPPIGIMLEVPVALFILEELMAEAEFLSVGSNDLAQYLIAADRGNPQVAHLYDQFDPGVLRAIQLIVNEAERLGKSVSLCGELAGDPRGALLVIGMGICELSMAPSRVLGVRKVIRHFSMAEAQSISAQALELADGSRIRNYLHATLEEAGLGGLVRAGR